LPSSRSCRRQSATNDFVIEPISKSSSVRTGPAGADVVETVGDDAPHAARVGEHQREPGAPRSARYWRDEAVEEFERANRTDRGSSEPCSATRPGRSRWQPSVPLRARSAGGDSAWQGPRVTMQSEWIGAADHRAASRASTVALSASVSASSWARRNSSSASAGRRAARAPRPSAGAAHPSWARTSRPRRTGRRLPLAFPCAASASPQYSSGSAQCAPRRCAASNFPIAPARSWCRSSARPHDWYTGGSDGASATPAANSSRPARGCRYGPAHRRGSGSSRRKIPSRSTRSRPPRRPGGRRGRRSPAASSPGPRTATPGSARRREPRTPLVDPSRRIRVAPAIKGEYGRVRGGPPVSRTHRCPRRDSSAAGFLQRPHRCCRPVLVGDHRTVLALVGSVTAGGVEVRTISTDRFGRSHRRFVQDGKQVMHAVELRAFAAMRDPLPLLTEMKRLLLATRQPSVFDGIRPRFQ